MLEGHKMTDNGWINRNHARKLKLHQSGKELVQFLLHLSLLLTYSPSSLDTKKENMASNLDMPLCQLVNGDMNGFEFKCSIFRQ